MLMDRGYLLGAGYQAVVILSKHVLSRLDHQVCRGGGASAVARQFTGGLWFQCSFEVAFSYIICPAVLLVSRFFLLRVNTSYSLCILCTGTFQCLTGNVDNNQCLVSCIYA